MRTVIAVDLDTMRELADEEASSRREHRLVRSRLP